MVMGYSRVACCVAGGEGKEWGPLEIHLGIADSTILPSSLFFFPSFCLATDSVVLDGERQLID